MVVQSSWRGEIGREERKELIIGKVLRRAAAVIYGT